MRQDTGPVPLEEEALRRALDDAGVAGWHVRVLPTVPSTNTYLLERAGRWPCPSLVAAGEQTAGLGRAGRTWQAEPGRSLTFSVLLPTVPSAALPWLPLAAGAAVVQAVRDLAAIPAKLKWPNDVVADLPGAPEVPGWGRRRKLAGILVQAPAGPGPRGLVTGIGLNTGQSPGQLPVPWAGSLPQWGQVPAGREEIAARIVAELLVRYDCLLNADLVGIRSQCREFMAGIGASVEAKLPGGRVQTGLALGVDDHARLELLGSDGTVFAVEAGDIFLRGQ